MVRLFSQPDIAAREMIPLRGQFRVDLVHGPGSKFGSPGSVAIGRRHARPIYSRSAF
jgi:hypothetical protein